MGATEDARSCRQARPGDTALHCERRSNRRALTLTAAVVVALLAPAVARAQDGSFHSSDPLLDRIWAASVRTAQGMLAPGPLTVDSAGRDCPIDEPVVILDGTDRDRCPYIGDEAVTGATLLVSTPSAWPALRDEIQWFANAQHADGAIPASPIFDGRLVLIDYPAYWVQSLYDYVLYTGDIGLAREVWPSLEGLLDRWYPSLAETNGLIANPGLLDYANIERKGPLVAYYNAGYALALEEAGSLAVWLGRSAEASAWRARAAALAAPFNATFWDPAAGAYLDSPTGASVHPEDGNVFAVLAGLAPPARARSALLQLARVDTRPYGNTIADDDVWDDPANWGTDAADTAYPFIGYFDVVARFATGEDNAALSLVEREWGTMLAGPQETMWEDIGPWDGRPTGAHPSFDHGWSTGAAPALTAYVLGVRPTSPGFATFVVHPQAGASVRWVSGVVPTPLGDIRVSWRRVGRRLRITVRAPHGERWRRG